MKIRKGLWSTKKEIFEQYKSAYFDSRCSCKDTFMVSQVQSVFFFQITSVINWNNINCALAVMQAIYLLLITVNISCSFWEKQKYAHSIANFQDKISVKINNFQFSWSWALLLLFSC